MNLKLGLMFEDPNIICEVRNKKIWLLECVSHMEETEVTKKVLVRKLLHKGAKGKVYRKTWNS